METFYVLLQCGLANRLRTLIGFLFIAEHQNKKVIFHWDMDDSACNGKFYDLFTKINSEYAELHECKKIEQKNINYLFKGQDVLSQIIKKYSSDAIPLQIQKDHLLGCPWICKIETQYYKRLIIKSDILNAVKNYCNKIGKFNAVHIRQTNHIQLAHENKCYTKFDEFEKFMDEFDELPMYLATDEYNVQLKYNSKSNIVIYKQILKTNSKKTRQTSLYDAFIEILICAKANKFKGSSYSSYSKLIEIYRSMRRNA